MCTDKQQKRAERSDFVVVPCDQSTIMHFRNKREHGDPYHGFGHASFRSANHLFVLGVSVGLNRGGIPIVAGAVAVSAPGHRQSGAYECVVTELETDPAIVAGKSEEMERMLITAAVRAAKALGYQKFSLGENVSNQDRMAMLTVSATVPLAALPGSTMQLPAAAGDDSIDV